MCGIHSLRNFRITVSDSELSFSFQEVRKLNESVSQLEHSVHKEIQRAERAEAQCRTLQADLDSACTRHPHPNENEGSMCPIHQRVSEDSQQESALWKELTGARSEAATAKARAAEARANADSAAAQLREAKEAHEAFEKGLASSLSVSDAEPQETCSQSILSQVQRLMAEHASLKEQLSAAKERVMEEQMAAVKVCAIGLCWSSVLVH